MKKDKLLRVLARLDKSEMKKAAKYIDHFISASTIPAKVFHHLYAQYPDFEDTAVDKAYIVEHILHLAPTAANKKRLSNAAHEIYDVLLDFLINEKLRSEPVQRDQLVIDVLRDRRLKDLAQKKVKGSFKKVTRMPDSIWKLFYLQKLHHLDYHYGPEDKLSQEYPALTQSLAYLNAFYYISKLKYLAELINRSNVVNRPPPPYEVPDLPADFWPEDQVAQLRDVYSRLFQFTQQTDDTIYQDLNGLLKSYGPQLAAEDRLVLFKYLLNYATRWVKQGRADRTLEVYQFYMYGVEEQIIFNQDQLDPDDFRNIVFVACGVGKLAEAKAFVSKYQNQVDLPETERENLIDLAKARIALAENDFATALGANQIFA